MFSKLLESVSNYLGKTVAGGNANEIPTATILTGNILNSLILFDPKF